MWNLPRPGIHPVSPAFAGTTEPPGKSRSRILFVPFIFNWSLIELQYYVSFCQTSTWISHRYTYVLESPSLFRPHPTLLRSRILKLGFSFFILNRHFFFFFFWEAALWQPTPVFLPGKSHGWRSLVGYRPWGRRVGHDWATSLSLSVPDTMLLVRIRGGKRYKPCCYKPH